MDLHAFSLLLKPDETKQTAGALLHYRAPVPFSQYPDRGTSAGNNALQSP
jgi:hypothetical protein